MSTNTSDIKAILNQFLAQAHQGGLKTSSYPKEWRRLKMKVSFGQGSPARVPWIAFTAPDMAVSNGYYPVYLYYKDIKQLVLAFGISDTTKYKDSWPAKVLDSFPRIATTFNGVPRYGESLVFRKYRAGAEGLDLTEGQLTDDLTKMIDIYQDVTETTLEDTSSNLHQSMFYMEKQLEDFLIQNWEHTNLARTHNLGLIFEDGELKSQQYPTSIGPIDILARHKNNKAHTVIELKKGQTSDDTIGQIARYMGWVKDNLKDPAVEGLIIAKGIDKKLEYALAGLGRDHKIALCTYNIDFQLQEFGSQAQLA